MSKEEWKNTGKSLGNAFKSLAKTTVRSANRVVDKAENKLEGKEDTLDENEKSVFADGSWKETGKQLGNAFSSLGKSILHSTEEGLDKAEDVLEKK